MWRRLRNLLRRPLTHSGERAASPFLPSARPLEDFGCLAVQSDQAFEALALLRKASINAYIVLPGADLSQMEKRYLRPDEVDTMLLNANWKIVSGGAVAGAPGEQG